MQTKRGRVLARLALLALTLLAAGACGRDREEPPPAEPTVAAAPVERTAAEEPAEAAQAAPTATRPAATATRARATAAPAAERPTVTPTTAPTEAPVTAAPVAERPAAAEAAAAAVPAVTVLPPAERAQPALPQSGNPLGRAVEKPEVAAEAPAGSGRVLPDRLEIAAIDLDTPVVEIGWRRTTVGGQTYSEWEEAEYAAGWHKNSALPGDGGNVVLSGHNNIAGAVFRELDQLKENDVMTLWVGDERVDYAVDQVLIVPDKFTSHEQRLKNGQYIQQFTDDRLTLVSCWPRNNNTHRIIVIGHRTGGADQTAAGDAPAQALDSGQ